MSIYDPKSFTNRKLKDKTVFDLNPITGQLDMMLAFNSNRIVTHARNPAGHLLTTYDSVFGLNLEFGDYTVTDNDGNVVICGKGGI